MSEKLSIQEAGKSRNFSGVGVIETETPEGDSCFWVPESERELEHEYVFSNGTYRPEKFGFSDIDVNVFDIFTDIDGNDWEIRIPDNDMPEITLDLPDLDIDFTIDDIGNIDIHIPGGDPDDWPGWDDLDPDIKVDFDDWWDDGKDPNDWPGWDDLDPDIKVDFDDWWDDGKDPNDWPGWDDLDPDIKVDFDDWWDDDKDPDDWPGWEDIDPDTKDDFDDWIDDKDHSFDPSEFGIDPDSDIDAWIDVDDMGGVSADISGMDMDGFDVDVNIDLDTLDVKTEYLPDTIKILTPPNKLEYRDGEPIDLTGAVVSAYYHNGTDVWANEKYPNGIIPLGELIVSPSSIDTSSPSFEPTNISDYEIYDEIVVKDSIIFLQDLSDISRRQMENLAIRNFTRVLGFPKNLATQIQWYTKPEDSMMVYSADNPYGVVNLASKRPFKFKYGGFWGTIIESSNGSFDNYPFYYASLGFVGIIAESYPPKETSEVVDIRTGEIVTHRIGHFNWALLSLYPDINGQYNPHKKRNSKITVTLSWPRPKDGKILSTSFNVTLEESDGTTTSGNYGGSHSSGNF